MDKINKLILLPIIAQICVILKDVFGITVGTEQQDLIATVAVLIFGLVGIWMNRHKKPKEVAGNEFVTPIEPSA